MSEVAKPKLRCVYRGNDTTVVVHGIAKRFGTMQEWIIFSDVYTGEVLTEPLKEWIKDFTLIEKKS